MVLKNILKQMVRSVGFEVSKLQRSEESVVAARDLSDADARIIEAVAPYTMTSVERLLALMDAVRYVSRNGVPGDVAECGVWKGGSMMAAALTFLEEGDTDRGIYLYDTFEGMSEPGEHDVSFDDVPASRQLAETERNTGVWCYSSLDEVKANVVSTGYPSDRLSFIKGKIEDTVPGILPESLSILRLDTDWYESTRHELEHLFPLLSPGGIMIIDDYGHWKGARKAVDEFLRGAGKGHYLHRIDFTGRLLVKR